MPFGTITATESTFGSISGSIVGAVPGTLSGSVGVPGPVGPQGIQGIQGPPGPPGEGGTWGSIVGTLSNQMDLQNALDAKQNVSGMAAYLTKAGNLSGLTDLATARDNLQLGALYTPTFAGVTAQGAGANVANLTSTSLSLNHATSGSFVIQPSSGITFPDTTVQTTAFNLSVLSPYALINSQVFTGTPSLPAGTIGVTAALGDNDTSLATTAFVQQELLSGTANAKNLEVYVRNQTGSTLAAGAIVYINGATGNRPTVTLAQANNDANSAQTMGFVKTAIANNGFGYVIVRGECENLDTSAVAEGTQLYLSPTVAGTYTTTKPSAPEHLVYVGIVIRSHPTQGVILVAVQNGYELNELHDVAITSPTNGQVLKYNSTTGLWYNGTDSAGVAWGGITGTLSSQTDLQTALDGKYSTTNPAGYITSSALTGYATESFVTSQGYITSSALSPYLTSATAASTYQTLSGMSDYLSKAGNLAGLASTSTARTNLGLGSLAIVNDAPSDGSQYARRNAAWEVVSSTSPYITSVSSPLSVTAGNLTVDLSAYAPLASPALTGNVTITSNSTGAALVITQDGTGDVIQFKDVTSDTTYSFIDQNGKVNTVASTTAGAGFRLPHGTAPTTPTDGDLWTTTGNLWVRISGTSQAIALQGNSAQLSANNTFTNASSTYGNSTAAGTINLGTGATISGATKAINIGTAGVSGSTTNITLGSAVAGALGTTTVNNLLSTVASTTTTAGLRVPHGTAPTTPVNGDIWTTTAAIFVRINGSSNWLVDGTTTQDIGASKTFSNANVSFGTSAGTGTVNVGTGATISGSTKTVNIGTSGVAGSTTNIAIGSTTGTSTTTLQGTTNGVTVAADTNSTALATTAYVVGQAGSATPLVDGTAAVGTSLRYARQDHVHPTDTSRAPLASPALTGTPTAPTATAGTNTTQIATTAFVQAAVPAVATLTETRQFSNATKISPPLNEIWAIMSQDYIDIDRLNFTYTTTGTPQYNQVGSITTASRLNATVASSVIGRPFGTSQVDQVSPFLFRENWTSNINFNRKTYLSGRAGSFVLLTESNFNQAFYYGKVEGDAIGDLTRRGFGWRWTGGAGSRFVNLVVHNGTTQTTVASSFAVTQEVAFDWDLYSDGAGNVTLYINGNQVATSNAGPTGYQSAGTYAWWREEVWTSGAPSFGNSTGYFRGGRAAILNY